jgi:hypothetical protein
MLFSMTVLPEVYAQVSTPSAPIVITGNIESITDQTMIVSGLTVDFSGAEVDVQTLVTGIAVQVTGVIVDGIIMANTVVIIVDESAPTPTATPALGTNTVPTSTPTPTATVPSDATLTVTPIATALEDDDDTVIIIEGPVTQININIITIFDINVQVSLDDPILKDLKVGDLVRVIGHASFDNDTIVIIVVNITIINIIVIDTNPGPGLPAGCKITPKGKIHCSKKK